MTSSNIPERRKHLYFYTLLILGAIFLANVKLPRSKPSTAATRAAQANQLANSLFQ